MLSATFLALVFTSGAFLAPVLERAGVQRAGLLRLTYAPLCHQTPERSLTLAGGNVAVCARCSGLYLGGSAGLFVGALLFVGRARRLRPAWLAIAVLPTLIDALLAWAGLPALSNVPRLVLAWPAGLLAGMFLALGLADLFGPKVSRESCKTFTTGGYAALEDVDEY